jgi:SAM-dependent methyltransferase
MRLKAPRVAFRYARNLVTVVERQHGHRGAAVVGARFVLSEAAMLPRLARWIYAVRRCGARADAHPPLDSEEIAASLTALNVEFVPYRIDVAAFTKHVAAYDYPPFYAAGPMDEGGLREQKLLEYAVSLDLLDLRATDVLIDAASQWSLFPDMVRKTIGATVYQQDLIYPPGIHDHLIGGDAARMPLPDAFVDALVLHSSFSHFEGSADTDFIGEAWRVLKPGGRLVIIPLFVAPYYAILSDPLVNRRGVVFDEGARVITSPWWHNRFGRLYDAPTLDRRVLKPAARQGFLATIYHATNAKEVHPRAHLSFILVLRKPDPPVFGSA